MKVHVTLGRTAEGEVVCLYAGEDAAAGMKELESADMAKFQEVAFCRSVRPFKSRRGDSLKVVHLTPEEAAARRAERQAEADNADAEKDSQTAKPKKAKATK